MRGSRLLLWSLLFVVARADMFHYYKMKKFLTAVAFARALGRRPTILPIPIPIPIPIGQNEVIRIPSGGSKTFMSLNGSPKYTGGFSGGGFLGGGKYTGSSSFGYPLPGNYDSSPGGGKYTGSTSFGYALPGNYDSSQGGPNVVFLDGSNGVDGPGGSDYAAPSNVIRIVSGKKQRFFGKPKRYIVTGGGGRTMRNSEIEWVPVRRTPRKISSSAKRKPIPVGEKFRLPP